MLRDRSLKCCKLAAVSFSRASLHRSVDLVSEDCQTSRVRHPPRFGLLLTASALLETWMHMVTNVSQYRIGFTGYLLRLQAMLRHEYMTHSTVDRM